VLRSIGAYPYPRYRNLFRCRIALVEDYHNTRNVEAAYRVIPDLHILPPRILDGVSEVEAASRPNGIDTSGLSVLVPGIAIFLPDSTLEPGLIVLVELICNILTRDKVSDVVALHLLDHLECVANDGFQETYDALGISRRL
jgi:hypothetical protein